MGYDGLEYADLPYVHLTTIRQPLKEMAAAAVDLLIETTAKKTTGEFTQKLLLPTLIVRNSCSMLK